MTFTKSDLEEYIQIKARIKDLEEQIAEVKAKKESLTGVQAMKYKKVSVQERNTTSEGSNLENSIVAYLDELEVLESQIRDEYVKLIQKTNEIKSWIEELSHGDRRIVELRVFKSLTWAEIADKTFYTPMGAWKRFHAVVDKQNSI